MFDCFFRKKSEDVFSSLVYNMDRDLVLIVLVGAHMYKCTLLLFTDNVTFNTAESVMK